MEVFPKPRVGNSKVLSGVRMGICGGNIPGQGYSLGKGLYRGESIRHCFLHSFLHPSFQYYLSGPCWVSDPVPGAGSAVGSWDSVLVLTPSGRRWYSTVAQIVKTALNGSIPCMMENKGPDLNCRGYESGKGLPY